MNSTMDRIHRADAIEVRLVTDFGDGVLFDRTRCGITLTPGHSGGCKLVVISNYITQR